VEDFHLLVVEHARHTKKSERDFALSPWQQIRPVLPIPIASLLIASLIAVVAINRTNTRCVFIPIVVGDDTYICWCSISIQVLVGVDVSLDWRVAVASPSEANYQQ
jgi:hypothetical protein